MESTPVQLAYSLKWKCHRNVIRHTTSKIRRFLEVDRSWNSTPKVCYSKTESHANKLSLLYSAFMLFLNHKSEFCGEDHTSGNYMYRDNFLTYLVRLFLKLKQYLKPWFFVNVLFSVTQSLADNDSNKYFKQNTDIKVVSESNHDC